jgi:hypothetical protein
MTSCQEGEKNIFHLVTEGCEENMRRAIFLGLRDDEGEPVDDTHPYTPGDVVTVYPRFSGYTGPFPWADQPEKVGGPWNLFRDSELKLLPEKELNLEDWL